MEYMKSKKPNSSHIVHWIWCAAGQSNQQQKQKQSILGQKSTKQKDKKNYNKKTHIITEKQ